MSVAMALLVLVHTLGATIWVGGMFFAYLVLRPVAAGRLEPPARLSLWAGCFDRFFVWVWIAVVILPLTGYWMSFWALGGMANGVRPRHDVLSRSML